MKVVTFVIQTILLIFLVSMAALFLSSKLTNNFQTYTVMSGSMEPQIPVGAYVVIKQTEDAHLKEGTVIAFPNPYDEYQTIVHRITKIERDGPVTEIHTKGDNNQTGDLFVLSSNDVIGELIFTLPYLGYLAQFIRTPLGFFIFIGIPALVICGLQFKKIKDGIHEEIMKKVNAHTKSELVGIFLLFFLCGAGVSLFQNKIVYANFNSLASVQNISFFGIATPSLSPSPTPTNVPGHGCNDISIIIEGNGAGSTNQVSVNCSSSIVIIQVNNVLGLSKVHYESTYISNGILQGVGGTIPALGKHKIEGELFFGTCSSDGCFEDTNLRDKRLKINLIK